MSPVPDMFPWQVTFHVAWLPETCQSLTLQRSCVCLSMGGWSQVPFLARQNLLVCGGICMDIPGIDIRIVVSHSSPGTLSAAAGAAEAGRSPRARGRRDATARRILMGPPNVGRSYLSTAAGDNTHEHAM